MHVSMVLLQQPVLSTCDLQINWQQSAGVQTDHALLLRLVQKLVTYGKVYIGISIRQCMLAVHD